MPACGSGDLDGGLVGHHLDDGLVLVDAVPLGDEPLDDLALGDAFPDVGQLELECHGWCAQEVGCVGAVGGRESVAVDELDRIEHAPLVGQVVVLERVGEGRVEAGDAS